MARGLHSVFPPLLLVLLMAGCASQGPAVVEQPTVEVTQLESTLITPDVVRFQAQIVIRNRGTAAIDFHRVDYAVDLFDQQLFSSSFAEMKRTKRRGTQTVTFPFQIAMKDILDQAVIMLAEGDVRVRFRGTVYPAASVSPMPFQDTFLLPLPKIPEVVFAGADGVPMSSDFRVRIRVRNRNAFAVSINRVDSYLEINDVRYQLLHTEQVTNLAPDGYGVVELRMENTTGKTLSMIVNTLSREKSEFLVGGTIECRSPYGWIVVPFTTERQTG